MPTWTLIFLYFLGIMSLLAGVYSIYLGYRFQTKAKETLNRKLCGYKPKTAVLVPCKGLDQNFEGNIRAILSQDYQDYSVFFIVDAESDRAYERLTSLIAGLANARLLVTESKPGYLGKIGALRTGISTVPKGYEVLAFADSDAEPPRTWLRDLVDALEEEGVGASTGYRWYFPTCGPWSLLRSSWNASTTNLLFHPDYCFAWGGAYAIKRSLLHKLGIPEAWRSEVSDDLVLTRLLRAQRKRIVFLPQCMVASFEDCTLHGLLEWTTRQTVITRYYRPGIWNYAVVSYISIGFLFLTGVGALLGALFDPTLITPGFMFITGLMLGTARSVQRLRTFQKSMREFSKQFLRMGLAFHLAGLMVPWLMLYNLALSAMHRRIRWRENDYEL